MTPIESMRDASPVPSPEIGDDHGTAAQEVSHIEDFDRHPQQGTVNRSARPCRRVASPQEEYE